jgi:membrane protein YqaA with SNARE-associated domain
MSRFVDWIKGLALAWGGPGLFIIGYLDSSFLSFPELNDLLLMGMVIQHKQRLPYYALMATLGSVLGCLTLYVIARKGGEAFLRKRFHERHVERGMELFRKYGLLVVIVPALLPPPAPFKIFILLAGVAEVPIWQFIAAVSIARFVRYAGEGLLAALYGEAAIQFITAHVMAIGLWLSGLALFGGAAWIVWQRRKRV